MYGTTKLGGGRLESRMYPLNLFIEIEELYLEHYNLI